MPVRLGRIIVLASAQGRYGTKNRASCSALRWAPSGWRKSAPRELGQHKTVVNAVTLGLIDTPMTRNEMRRKLAVTADIGRAAQPGEPLHLQGGPARPACQRDRCADFSLSQWTAPTPKQLLGSHLGLNPQMTGALQTRKSPVVPG